MTNNEQDFEMCMRAENVILPKYGHFGLSAATGGLAGMLGFCLNTDKEQLCQPKSFICKTFFHLRNIYLLFLARLFSDLQLEISDGRVRVRMH